MWLLGGEGFKALFDGVLRLGVVEQLRHTQGGVVDNVTRGYRRPGENALENGVREFIEETGVNPGENAIEIFEPSGKPVNMNSANYETWGDNEGVNFFACYVSPELLTQDGNTYTFRRDLIDTLDEERKKEQIFKAKFITASEALQSNDAFTIIIVGRIMLHLRNEGVDFRLG